MTPPGPARAGEFREPAGQSREAAGDAPGQRAAPGRPQPATARGGTPGQPSWLAPALESWSAKYQQAGQGPAAPGSRGRGFPVRRWLIGAACAAAILAAAAAWLLAR